MLARLAEFDSNTISDALDFLGLPGATFGIRPLWDCPRTVGRATTVLLGPKSNPAAVHHPITPVIADAKPDDIIVVAGGLPGISSWGDIVANACKEKKVRGAVLDGNARDIEGSESIGFPVFGRGITMISARNRAAQISAYEPVQFAGVTVRQGDYVIADRCGTVFVPQDRIEDVLDLAERINIREAKMIEAIRAGRSVAEVMHDREFNAIMEQ